MTERIKTLKEIKDKICSKLREARSKVESLNEILSLIQFEINAAEFEEEEQIKLLREAMNNNDPEFGD